MLAAISRIAKPYKILSLSLPWQKVVILKNQGGSVFLMAPGMAGDAYFFFLFNNKYVIIVA